jgi:5-methylcytosine-specific restriction protein A
MRTFMMTWHPGQGRPEDLSYAIRDIAKGRPCKDAWSSGSRKNVPVGSRVFLVRQGVELKGIVASGYTRSEPEQNDDPDDHSWYCDVAWTMALDADAGEVLTVRQLRRNRVLSEVPWGIAGGGREFSHEEATEVERLWAKLLAELDKAEVKMK